MHVSTKEKIKEQLFREALSTGRVRPCDGCNEYHLRERLARGTLPGDLICSSCTGS